MASWTLPDAEGGESEPTALAKSEYIENTEHGRSVSGGAVMYAGAPMAWFPITLPYAILSFGWRST